MGAALPELTLSHPTDEGPSAGTPAWAIFFPSLQEGKVFSRRLVQLIKSNILEGYIINSKNVEV